MKNRKKHHSYSSLIAAIFFLVCSGLILIAARKNPGFAQWYAITVYPVLQGSLGWFSGLFPFSLAEMLCTVLPVFLAADIANRTRKVYSSHSGAADQILCFLRNLLLLFSILLFLYSANCGVNYYREPFVDQELYSKAVFTDNDLVEFCEYTVSMLNDLCAVPDGSTSTDYPDGPALADEAVSAMHDLSAEYPGLTGFYPRPKLLTFMSRFFSMMGVSGIYSPFTIEANVNGEMPGLEKPFTSCHELSHLKGYMNEGEANYIGWLACIGSDNPSFRRSGWLIAWIYAGSSLRHTNSELFSEIYIKLPEEAVAELKENNTFWTEHETKASEVQDRVNDAYLKSNGQQNGIQTYEQLTTLMLLWFHSNDRDDIDMN